MNKLLTSTIIAFAFCFSTGAFANWSSSSALRTEAQSQEIDSYLYAFEAHHPELDVWVLGDDGPVVLNELKALKSVVTKGQQVGQGELMHLACCNPACGGGGCKGK